MDQDPEANCLLVRLVSLNFPATTTTPDQIKHVITFRGIMRMILSSWYISTLV
jgi:hypothetical protein